MPRLTTLNEEALREDEPKKALPGKKKLPHSLNANYLPKNRPRQLFPLQSGQGDKKMLISGNEALSLGAMAAGCKFMAAYPMTPSSLGSCFCCRSDVICRL